jgi:hypothetical protein
VSIVVCIADALLAPSAVALPAAGATSAMVSTVGVAFAAAIASRSEQCAQVHAPSSVSVVDATRHAGRTVIVAAAVFVGSTVLAAVTVHVPAVSGAFHVTVRPVPVIVPQFVDHCTVLSLVPVTAAVRETG